MTNLHITLTPFRNETRVLKETGSLVRHGVVNKVLIVALHEEGLPERQEIDEFRAVWRVKLRSREWSKNFFSQILKYFEFCWKVSVYANQNQVKIINVHSLDLLPLGVCLKFWLGVKVVYDAHELETEVEGLKGVRKLVSKTVEYLFIRYVDLTIVVGSEIENWYREAYSISSITTVLNCPPYRSRTRLRLLRDELRIPDHQKIVLYQGALSSGRGIEFLLDTFQSSERDDYVLVFMGYGEMDDYIISRSKKCPRIFYKPAVLPSIVLNYTASADIGVALIEDTNLSYRFCLPNKLFESIMARIPVIVSDLPEMRRIVSLTGTGVMLRAWNADAFFTALDEMSHCGNTFAENLDQAAGQYCWEVQESKLLNAYRAYIV